MLSWETPKLTGAQTSTLLTGWICPFTMLILDGASQFIFGLRLHFKAKDTSYQVQLVMEPCHWPYAWRRITCNPSKSYFMSSTKGAACNVRVELGKHETIFTSSRSNFSFIIQSVDGSRFKNFHGLFSWDACYVRGTLPVPINSQGCNVSFSKYMLW